MFRKSQQQCLTKLTGRFFAAFSVATLALYQVALGGPDQGKNRQPDDKLTGNLVVETEEGEKRVAKEIDSVLEVEETGNNRDNSRNFEFTVVDGKFTSQQFSAGKKYRIRLRRSGMDATDWQYKGRWKLKYPKNTSTHNVTLTVQPIPHEDKTLTVQVKYQDSGRPIEGALLTLWQIRPKDKTCTGAKTNKKGKVHLNIAHRPNSKYKVEFSNEHSSIEELPDDISRYDKYKYPPLASYESSTFRLTEVDETFVWEVRAAEKTVVVDVKGQLDLPKGRNYPVLYLETTTYPEGHFKGVHTDTKENGNVVKKYWVYGAKRGSSLSDDMAMVHAIFREDGSLVELKRATEYKEVISVEQWAALTKRGKHRRRAVFHRVPDGEYTLRAGDMHNKRVRIRLAHDEPISITPDSQLPLTVETKVKACHPPEYATLTGKVTDKEGRPIKQARVMAQAPTGRRTDVRPDGTYKISALLPGYYVIRVRKESGKYVASILRKLEKGKNRLDFTGKRTPFFEGTVQSVNGEPVSQADISAIRIKRTGKTKYYDARSQQNGSYKLPVSKNDAYYAIRVQDRGEDFIAYHEKRVKGPNTQLDFTLHKTRKITGSVSIPAELADKCKPSFVTAMKALHDFPLPVSECPIKQKSEFTLQAPVGTFKLYLALSTQEKKLHVLPLGKLKVPQHAKQKKFEKQVTRQMLEEGWTFKEFKRRAMEAKRKFNAP